MIEGLINQQEFLGLSFLIDVAENPCPAKYNGAATMGGVSLRNHLVHLDDTGGDTALFFLWHPVFTLPLHNERTVFHPERQSSWGPHTDIH